MLEILTGLIVGACLFVGAIAAAHLFRLYVGSPRGLRDSELAEMVAKHGLVAIAEARMKCAELPPSAERAAWGLARFGRDWVRIEPALYLTDR